MSKILLQNVSLEYDAIDIGRRKRNLISKINPNLGGALHYEKDSLRVCALDSLNLKINSGDRVALIGQNGAGKSTLLRLLAGLYKPTLGNIEISGRISSIFSLRFGFDNDASGIDNIYLRSLYLGLSSAEIDDCIDSIVELSELGDYIHLPIRTYSAGMVARLAFAITTQQDADILLLDEAVGAGDAAFLAKATARIENFVARSNIFVFASHSNRLLKELCDKAVLLDHGKLVHFGSIEETLEEYQNLLEKRNVNSQSCIQRNTITIRNSAMKEGHLQLSKEDVVLVNDASITPNTGCKAVRIGYEMIFNIDSEKSLITHSIPVHYWADKFQELALPNKLRIKKENNCFITWQESVPLLDIDKWEELRSVLYKQDKQIQYIVEKQPLIIVNGEGSIHHNAPRALSLLAIIKSLAINGCRVVLSNCTIQAMNETILKDALSKVWLIHSREPGTQKYLQTLGMKSILGPDLALLAMHQKYQKSNLVILNPERYVLVTSGVNVNEKDLLAILDAVEGVGQFSAYFCIGDGGESNLVARICTARSVPVIYARDIPPNQIVAFLSQFSMAISGRHHINMFLAAAGVPFIPLPSNTWKIEETIHLLEYPINPIKRHSDLEPALNNMKTSLESYRESVIHSYERGMNMVESVRKEIRKCIF